MIIKKRDKTIEKIEKKPIETLQTQSEKVDIFDLDNLDFSQRQERRRGDRRRGYRRIDDRNLISRAQEEAGTIKENAAQEGYKAGLEKAQNDIAQFRDSIMQFLKSKDDVFEYIAPDILEISVDIAQKIVKKEIEQDPQIVLETVLDVLKTLSKDEPKLKLKVNPSQVNLVKDAVPAMVSSLGVEARINVFADATIEIGNCIIETSNGVVDATVDTQLEIIKEVFKGM